MLPKLLDAGQFRHAVGIDAMTFAEAGVNGALPRAAGMFRNAALWLETDVRSFANNAGFSFADDWQSAAVANENNTPSATSAPASVGEVNTTGMVADNWPDEMSQVMACEYAGVSTNWLGEQVKAGLVDSRREHGFVIYRRKDLDALMELPAYKYRKRRGYTNGKPNGRIKPAPANAPTPMATLDDHLGESAAALHLGMHREVLSLARKDGIGPPVVWINNQPRYRVADLDAFKAANAKAEGSRPISSTERAMDSRAAARYLGLTIKQLQNLATHGNGPVHEVKRDGLGGKGRALYSAMDLENWKAKNTVRLSRMQRAAGETSAAHAVKATKSTAPTTKKATLGGRTRARAGVGKVKRKTK
jgi:hypothetical protein